MTKVSTTDFYRIPGIYEPIEYVVETHTVCDECGSADISYKADAHLPETVDNGFAMVFYISFFGSIVLGLGVMVLSIYKYDIWICGLGLFSVIDFLVFGFLTSFVERNNNKNPKCNNCGNEHIT